MEKLYALFSLFRKGNEVADPELYKNGAMAISVLVPFILAMGRVGQAFGLDMGISEADAGAIAAGVVSVVAIVSHLITSKKVGLPAQPAQLPSADTPRFGNGTS